MQRVMKLSRTYYRCLPWCEPHQATSLWLATADHELVANYVWYAVAVEQLTNGLLKYGLLYGVQIIVAYLRENPSGWRLPGRQRSVVDA